jgi:ABC-type multidrug transport system fused ATPase/permease subunit
VASVLLLAASVGSAFVSRVAKNFQDYFTNVITQRVGAQMYSDGIRHSLELPYSVFEDQRSGETLGKLQKARSDTEKFLNAVVNVLFLSLVGVVFVTIFGILIHGLIAVVYLLSIPALLLLIWTLSSKVKRVQKEIFTETAALAGATTESLRNIELVKSLGLAGQEISRLNATTEKILHLELKKGSVFAQPELYSGNMCERTPQRDSGDDVVFGLPRGNPVRTVCADVVLFLFYFWANSGNGQRHQHLPRNRSIAEQSSGYLRYAD